MARLLTVLLIFAALAGCSYNWLQVQRLQKEIDTLNIEVSRKAISEHRAKAKLETDATPNVQTDADSAVQDEIDGWNSLAAEHYSNAQKAMSKSDAALAAKEYGAYMDDKRKALVLEEHEAVRSIDTLRKLAGIKADSGPLTETPGKPNP